MSMILINWNDRYNTNIEIIDEQHKKLVDLINKLFQSFSEGKAQKTIESILQEMLAYTKYHFDTEEAYFKQLKYEQSEEHIAEHKHFIDQTEQFITDLKSNKISTPFSVMEFLREWLLQHISLSDKKFAKDFLQKSKKSPYINFTKSF